MREYIFAGDIFQANLSQRFEAPLDEPPWALYRALRRAQPGAVRARSSTCRARPSLSASPERFLRVERRRATSRRGRSRARAPRGVGPEHDAALGQALTESAKDRAENLMIVDLMRNDLSRVCAPGTRARVGAVRARALRHRAPPGLDGRRRPRARAPTRSTCCAPRFPAARSPARRSCARWRSSPSWSRRGAASTAARIGYWSLTGALDTSIAIRTAVVRDGRVYFSAGGGIVADSDPEQEYRETLDKARGMIDALAGTRMILVLDNYDSFVHNLARYVRELGGEAVVRRNDEMTLDDVAALAPSHIIISPGPCTPREAGISTDVVRRFGPTTPILGVCLGHQCIGAAYGGDIVRAGRPMHGKTSRIDARRHRASSPACRRRCAWRAITRWSSRRTALPAVAARRGRARRGRRRDHGGRAPRASGGRRAVPSGVGGHAARLRAARSLPARRAARGSTTCRRAPTAPATTLGAPVWGMPDDERAPFVPPPVEQVR